MISAWRSGHTGFSGPDVAESLPTAFAAMAADRVDTVIVLDSARAIRNSPRIAELAATHRLPAIYPNKGYHQATEIIH